MRHQALIDELHAMCREHFADEQADLDEWLLEYAEDGESYMNLLQRVPTSLKKACFERASKELRQS